MYLILPIIFIPLSIGIYYSQFEGFSTITDYFIIPILIAVIFVCFGLFYQFVIKRRLVISSTQLILENYPFNKFLPNKIELTKVQKIEIFPEKRQIHICLESSNKYIKAIDFHKNDIPKLISALKSINVEIIEH